MKHATANYSLFINSLLSSKEILIRGNNDIQITECSVFKNSKTIIPVDLIEPQAKKGSRPDYQWLLFGLLNFIAAALFISLALSQYLTFPLGLAATFTLLGLLSVYASFKYKNITYAYQYKDSDINLFTLTGNDLNASQISEFTEMLNLGIVNNSEVNNEINGTDKKSTEANNQHLLIDQVYSYSEHLEFLYNEGIIDDVLLDRLRQKIHNKVYGIIDTRPLANVIPLPMTAKEMGA